MQLDAMSYGMDPSKFPGAFLLPNAVGYGSQYMANGQQTPGSPGYAPYANSFPSAPLDLDRRQSPPSIHLSQQFAPYIYAPEDFAKGSEVIFTGPSEMPHPAYGTCSLRGKRPGNEDRLFCLTKLDTM